MQNQEGCQKGTWPIKAGHRTNVVTKFWKRGDWKCTTWKWRTKSYQNFRVLNMTRFAVHMKLRIHIHIHRFNCLSMHISLYPQTPLFPVYIYTCVRGLHGDKNLSPPQPSPLFLSLSPLYPLVTEFLEHNQQIVSECYSVAEECSLDFVSYITSN